MDQNMILRAQFISNNSYIVRNEIQNCLCLCIYKKHLGRLHVVNVSFKSVHACTTINLARFENVVDSRVRFLCCIKLTINQTFAN